MAKKLMQWKTKGMNQDLSVSAFNPEFAFENMNLRLSTNEGNTLMSWVNEKGTEEISIENEEETAPFVIRGVPIGTAVINHQLVLFTTGAQTPYYDSQTQVSTLIGNPDFIYVLRYNENKTKLLCKKLYEGNLNFSTESPLETMVSYEAEHIQKVYWTDGRNQPRVINIAEDTSKYTNTSFNFVPNITKFANSLDTLSDVIAGLKVERGSSDGMFAPGVIQYCFTYINKYRQQTNIIDVSPLHYLTYNDRAASPEDKISSSFNITITNANNIFDYVRLYSIQRTSLNLEPIVKVLGDLPIINGEYKTEDIKYVDNGTTGSLIDPTELLYVGGKEITALTMTDKDGTLFMGNIEEKNVIVNDIQEYFDSVRGASSANGAVEYAYGKSIEMEHTTGIYSHTNTLNSSQDKITTFKGGETYRFGFQLQKVTGEWTEPIFIEDKKNPLYPKTSVFSDTANLVDASANINFYSVTEDPEASPAVNDKAFYDRFNQFIRVRPIIVFPNQTDRNVLCQGVLNPTVFNVQDRKTSSPFAQASWYFRPYMANLSSQNLDSGSTTTPFELNREVRAQQSTFVDSNFEGRTHNVYIIAMQLRGALNVIVTNGMLNYGIRTEQTRTPLASRVEGVFTTVINTKTYYIFVLSDPIAVPSNSETVEFPYIEPNTTAIYDNHPYQLYNGMYTEDMELRYGGDGQNDTYSFYFCDLFDSNESGFYYTVTFNKYDKNDYSTIVNSSLLGNQLRYVHYSSLPAEEDIGVEVKEIEIQGSTRSYTTISDDLETEGSNTQFFVDQSIVTLNSPDIEFDTDVQVADPSNLKLRIVGAIPITANVSAHKITTSSSMLELSRSYSRELQNLIGKLFTTTVETTEGLSFGGGELDNNVIHKNIDTAAGQRLVADYLWNDIIVKYDPNKEDKVETYGYKADYLIYPWHRSGSLNNDSRPSDSASSLLRTKKESNLLYSIASEYFPKSYQEQEYSGKNFSSIGCQMVLTENAQIMNYRLPKQLSTTSEINYYPNIDKILYNKNGYKPVLTTPDGVEVPNVDEVYTPISMKYKSTSHAVISLNGTNEYIPILPSGDGAGGYSPIQTTITTFWGDTEKITQSDLTATGLNALFNKPNVSENQHVKFNYLWLGELYKEENPDTKFGGSSKEALRNNTWCVAGEAKPFGVNVNLRWTIGDTYYQRYDCLKTYPFTNEDPNQLIEILSFMCETHVNIDGRYDRNRGQADNTNMSPINFNLLNPVYSQTDNFFVAKKTNTEDLDRLVYPNQIFYSKNKTSGADVDLWTNVTLASMLELDGDKGSVNKLTKLNDSIVAFQDSGISQILYNENTALSTTNGVPVEIANSGKVQGKKYISDTIGCRNKWSVCNTPNGIYFIDDNDKGIYLFNGQLSNISVKGGLNTWCKNNILSSASWTPTDYSYWPPLVETGFDNFVTYYDRKNQDVLFINKNISLAWSEKLGAFTSFYDYGKTPYLCNIDEDTLWIKPDTQSTYGTNPGFLKRTKIWQHNGGGYCDFFRENKPYWTTFVGNPEPQIDKTFTNIEFRATVDGDGSYESNENTGKFSFKLPFDSLETWNEYQHGVAILEQKQGHGAALHHWKDMSSSLNRKFRIWRCDIPRDNAPLSSETAPEGITYTQDDVLGISRFNKHPLDRMRNPWIYLKLMKNAADDEEALPRAEIHDVMMTYFE